MRLGKVIGRVTLNSVVPSLTGARWLIVTPFNRSFFQNGNQPPEGISKEPTLVVYDNLGADVGQTIGFVEGREAAQPFVEPAPVDAFNAALIDYVFYEPFKKLE